MEEHVYLNSTITLHSSPWVRDDGIETSYKGMIYVPVEQ